MEIREPVFIKKLRAEEFEATGTLEGYGVIRRRGHSLEEAKNRFFETCNRIGPRIAGRDYVSKRKARSA
jgi:hypothetical protein